MPSPNFADSPYSDAYAFPIFGYDVNAAGEGFGPGTYDERSGLNVLDTSVGRGYVLPEGYDGPLLVGSPGGGESQVLTDPSLIADYRHDARTRNLQGAATVASLVGGAALGGAMGAGPGSVPGTTAHTGTATITGSNTAAGMAQLAGAGTTLPAAVGGAGAAAGGGGLFAGLSNMNPLVLSSLISGGSSLLGGAMQGRAAGDAADLSREMYGENQRLQQPFVQSGYGANTRLADLLGLSEGGSGDLLRPFDAETFAQYKDPGYDFRLQQGNQALLNRASAGSGSMSGAALKDLMAYNQDAASQEYGNAFNRYQVQQGNVFGRLSEIMRGGQSAAAGVGSAGTQAAATGGQAVMNQGSAYGGGVVGAGNAGGQALQNHWLFNTAEGRQMWN